MYKWVLLALLLSGCATTTPELSASYVFNDKGDVIGYKVVDLRSKGTNPRGGPIVIIYTK